MEFSGIGGEFVERTWAGSDDSRWRFTPEMFSGMSDDSSHPELLIGYPERKREKTLSAASGLAARGAGGRKSSQNSPSSELGADLYLSRPDELIGGCTGRFRSLETGEPYITSHLSLPPSPP
uniref:Uncharacterized protein n=1 Tax=Oryza brachyantha TaxID=4533 RepID=J3MU99_ORYBR